MNPDDAAVKRLLDHLHRVGETARRLDDQPRTFDTGAPLTRAEIHMVSELAGHPELGVTGLAELQGVTKGAVSQMVSRLVRKGLVRKDRSSGRGVRLVLTEVGQAAHRAHVRFHADMARFVAEHYDDSDVVERDAEALHRLIALMHAWERRVNP